MLKQFDPEQWALFDAPAKQAATEFWERLGFNCIENPDEFGIDLLVSGKARQFVETLWKKLPIGVTTSLGPKVRKYISL